MLYALVVLGLSVAAAISLAHIDTTPAMITPPLTPVTTTTSPGCVYSSTCLNPWPYDSPPRVHYGDRE